MDQSPARARYRVLCLHGMGTNSDIFELQTAGLRYQLGPAYDFTFVDGGHPWPPAPGVETAYSTAWLSNCYSYYDGTASSAAEAVRDLAAYVCTSGPFDCIFGFSLGASLAATLLLQRSTEPELQEARTMIKSAVFVCAISSQHWPSLVQGDLKSINPADMSPGERLAIRTVHAWSPNDFEYRSHGETLMRLCVDRQRRELVHEAGHAPPKEGKDITALAEAVRWATESEIGF